MEEAGIQYDFRGMQCPMPIVQITRVIRDRRAGELVTVVADDPAFCFDIESWCRRTGHKLVRIVQTAEKCEAVIRVTKKTERDVS